MTDGKLQVFDSGSWRDMTDDEFTKFQDDNAVVPRKWLRALLIALVAKGVFTVQEVTTFMNNNR